MDLICAFCIKLGHGASRRFRIVGQEGSTRHCVERILPICDECFDNLAHLYLTCEIENCERPQTSPPTIHQCSHCGYTSGNAVIGDNPANCPVCFTDNLRPVSR
jgi:hypothetical protein